MSYSRTLTVYVFLGEYQNVSSNQPIYVYVLINNIVVDRHCPASLGSRKTSFWRYCVGDGYLPLCTTDLWTDIPYVRLLAKKRILGSCPTIRTPKIMWPHPGVHIQWAKRGLRVMKQIRFILENATAELQENLKFIFELRNQFDTWLSVLSIWGY